MYINQFSNNPQIFFQGLTQWAVVPLGPALIYNPNKKQQYSVMFINLDPQQK